MSELNLQPLIDRLDQECKQALEDAVSVAFNQGHAVTTLEHWLQQLLQVKEGSVAQSGMDTTRLQQAVQTLIDRFPVHTDCSPGLAPELIQLLQHICLNQALHQGVTTATTVSIHELMATMSEDPRWPDVMQHALVELVQALEKTRSNQNVNCSESAMVLARYTQNLTEKARQGEIDPVIGREQEIHNVITILLRRRQNNPLLMGEAGVGKTAVAEGLALAIVENKVPKELCHTEILSVDLAALQAGASGKGEFEKRLQAFVKAVQTAENPTVLFIDEVHNLLGAGNQAGQGDAANLLKPLLARGELRSIAATTWAEYKKFIEPDPALTRRFQLIKIAEPSQPHAEAILRGLKSKLAHHHSVCILEEAIAATVKLSTRYITDKQLPDKALTLLDSACAQVNLSHIAVPVPLQSLQMSISAQTTLIQDLQEELQQGFVDSQCLTEARQKLKTLQADADDLTQQWTTAKTIHQELLEAQRRMNEAETKAQKKILRKQIQHCSQRLSELNRAYPNLLPCVDKTTIANVVAEWTGIPVNKMLADNRDKMNSLRATLQQRVIGQVLALDVLTQRVNLSLAQLHDPNKPLGVYLLCGTSGVGKTETALALAEALHGTEQQLITLNMSEYQEAHKVSQLLGSPAGYVGFGEGGALTEAVRKQPYSVLLLDELEKSHPSVQELFYQVFDKGTLTDATGREVNFKNTTILMTTNVGTDTLTQVYQTQNLAMEYDTLVEQLQPELNRAFKPAFLGRTTVLPYLPLTPEHLSVIAEIKLAKVRQRYEQHCGKAKHLRPEIVPELVAACTDMSQGARVLDRLIEARALA